MGERSDVLVRRVVCAYAERASGPGWANTPVWYITRDGDGGLRSECLQPGEQTAEILALYDICAAAHVALTSAVQRIVNNPKRKVTP